jgi:hypothetical protein
VNYSLPNSGFYLVAYNGNSRVIVSYDKDLQEKIESSGVISSFDTQIRYFVFKKDRYYSVKSKKSILKVFREQKASLRSFIKKNKLQFKDNREQSLGKVAEHYDILIQQQ